MSQSMSEFCFDIVGDPEIFMENRLPAHSDHRYYRPEESAGLRSLPAFSRSRVLPELTDLTGFRHLLNGSWFFSYAKNYTCADHHFMENEVDCRTWETIRVPGHMQMQGYGKPQYVNTQYPWDGTDEILPGEIPQRFNPVGCYVRYFTLPEAMKDGPVYISFGGVESGFALWLNGKYIGYSEDSFTPSEFDLTGAVDREGENKLGVMVFRFTAGSWCEDQDFFRFSGIFRDVYLYTVPEVHIWDLRV